MERLLGPVVHFALVFDRARNGIFLDGSRISKESRTPIRSGQSISFGGSPESAWKVLDCEPPQNLLVCLDEPDSTLQLNKFHALPSEEQPLLSVYLSEHGEWVCEEASGQRPLADGDLIHVENRTWRFFSAGPEAATLTRSASRMQQATFNRMQFFFEVSNDEEHVAVKINTDNKSMDLGERAHNYTLLTLARIRLADYIAGVDPISCGWICFEEFCDMLRMEPQHINIHIYRARKQVMALFPDAEFLPNVVERRSGDLRFGYPSLKIQRGSVLEGEANFNK